MRKLFYILTLVIAINAPSSHAQTAPSNEQVKIQELESQIDTLEALMRENKENNLLLIQNANRSVDYANGLTNFLTILISIATLIAGALALYIKSKLAEIAQTNRDLRSKMKFEKLLSEARFLALSGQRFEAEQKASEMRKIKPDSIYGYFFEGLYLRSVNRYSEAYKAMEKANEVLGTHAYQTHFNMACYAALDGDSDLAFKHLETVYQINKNQLAIDITDKDLDDIRTDLRFIGLAEKLNPNNIQ